MGETQPVPIPELLRRIADAGDAAQRALAVWGVKIEADNRLHQAAAQLRAIAMRGHIEHTHEAVLPLLRAAWVAADFADIAEYLPEQRVKSIRHELSTALDGSLWPARGGRQALQLQTQHWVGAILVHAGLDLEHAVFSSKRAVKIPEFFVHDGANRIGIEVKRPESQNRLRENIDNAMAKFGPHRCFGAIVIEISDCTSADSKSSLSVEAEGIMRNAHQMVWDDSTNRPHAGYEKLIYLGGIVRGGWQVAADDASRFQFIGEAHHNGYVSHPGTVHAIISDRLRSRFNQAFDAFIDRLGAIVRSRPGA